MNPNMMNRNAMGYYGMNRSRRNMAANNDCVCSGGNSEPNNDCGCSGGNNKPNNDCGCSGGNNKPNNDCGCSGGNNMLNHMNQNQLLCYLNQVSFSMYDTVLFLDTHPLDQEAMTYFKEMQEARKCALDVYQQNFGPLLLDDVDADCEWTWGMEPLPWENCKN